MLSMERGIGSLDSCGARERERERERERSTRVQPERKREVGGS